MFELHFTCPKQGKEFRSARWSVDPDLEAVTDPEDRKHLRGLVHVPCPFCDEPHAYTPDELACPLQPPNTAPASNSQPPDS
ncbi:hypothetical protein [Desulfonatronum thiodismutans]|uniref:hypothetical protein n=1 Tax=Desulfonatronum thiodismutans TaxID=159290 RepID=UPI0012698003|nr:hypothetical protein [Desulfonatronum thiodismutans]